MIHRKLVVQQGRSEDKARTSAAGDKALVTNMTWKTKSDAAAFLKSWWAVHMYFQCHESWVYASPKLRWVLLFPITTGYWGLWACGINDKQDAWGVDTYQNGIVQSTAPLCHSLLCFPKYKNHFKSLCTRASAVTIMREKKRFKLKTADPPSTIRKLCYSHGQQVWQITPAGFGWQIKRSPYYFPKGEILLEMQKMLSKRRQRNNSIDVPCWGRAKIHAIPCPVWSIDK